MLDTQLLHHREVTEVFDEIFRPREESVQFPYQGETFEIELFATAEDGKGYNFVDFEVCGVDFEDSEAGWVGVSDWDDGQVAGSGGEDIVGDEVADLAGGREDVHCWIRLSVGRVSCILWLRS